MENLKECKHNSGSEIKYTHTVCVNCGKVRTDGGWGVASRKWFDNLEQAKFYEKNGFLPK